MGPNASLESIARFNHCYGCGVCTAVCPHQAISMKQNTEGFYAPVVNNNCTQCSLCLKVCAFHTKEEMAFTKPLKSFAGWSVREDVRDFSTSGGVIFEICSEFIKKGFKICAVKYNYEKKRAEHFLFDTVEDLYSATGSKYIQSYSQPALSSINWKKEKYVVIGTPCMIGSLRELAKMHGAEDNMLLIDFFCHGMPSYLMWKKYEEHVSSLVGSLQSVSWRNKDNGWQDSTTIKAKGEHGRYFSSFSTGDLFFKFFFNNRCLNECCYDDCIFRLDSSLADVRVGDLWSKELKYVNNRLGINSILVFSLKGLEALQSTTSIHLEEDSFESIIGQQMRNNPKRPASFRYVSQELKGITKLSNIAKQASRIEHICALLSYKYYKDLGIRIINKLRKW